MPPVQITYSLKVDLLGYHHSGFTATQAHRTPDVRIPTLFTTANTALLTAVNTALLTAVYSALLTAANTALLTTANNALLTAANTALFPLVV